MKHLLILISILAIMNCQKKQEDKKNPFIIEGEVLIENGNYQKAWKLFNDLEEQEVPLDEFNQVLLLKNLGIISFRLANYKVSQQYLNKAKKYAEINLPLNDPEFLEINNYLAFNYYDLGQHNRATFLLDSVVAVFENLPPSYYLADTYDALGTYYGEKHDFQTARKYFEKAKTIRKNEKINPNPILADYYDLYSSGMFHRTLGDYKEAIKVFNKGLDIVENHGLNELKKAALQYHLARCYNNTGEHDRALSYLEQSLQFYLKEYKESHPLIAEIYDEIGFAYRKKGKYDFAMQYHQKAVELLETNAGKSDFILGSFYHNYALTEMMAGEYEKSKSRLEKSLKILQKYIGKRAGAQRAVYNARSSLADWYLYQGEKEVYTAIEQYKELIQDIQEQSGKYSLIKFLPLHNLGLSYRYLREFKPAMDVFNQGLELIKLTQSPTSFSTCLEPSYAINVLWSRAETYYLKYILSKDHPISQLKEAAEAYDWYLSYVDYLRSQFHSEVAKINFAALHRVAYDRAVTVNFELYDTLKDDFYLNKAFEASEKSKSLVLLEAIKGSKADKYQKVPKKIIERETGLRKKVELLEKQQLGLLLETRIDSSLLHSVKGELIAAQEKLFQFFEEIKISSPEYYQLKFNTEVITIPALQKNLAKESSSMIQYFPGKLGDYAFLITPDTAYVRWLYTDKALSSDIVSLVNSISRDSMLNDGAAKRYAELGLKLYNSLLKEFKGDLTKRLVIVPDGAISNLPFEALLTDIPLNPIDFSSHPYLVNKHEISYAYSATLHQEMLLKKIAPSKNKSLNIAPSYLAKKLQFDSINYPPLIDLPNNQSMARKIEEIVRGDLLLGSKATKKRFLKIAPEYRLLNLFTHGKANFLNGELGHIGFHDGCGKVDCSLLFIQEIYNQEFNADLVVLDGCEMAIGERKMGEGLISLARAFSYAGAKSLVGTLWSISNSNANEALFTSFYNEIVTGSTKDRALAQAKRSLIKRGGLDAHPFYWAGFIGIGDMAAIYNKSNKLIVRK